MSMVVDIEKRLGRFHLKLAFEAENETLALLGASGGGKSLALRCIAGVEKPDKGKILVDGKTLFDSEKGINLSPQQRRLGLMFQNYALFPNMTVWENIRCGARRERDKARREEQAAAVMESFGLAPLAGHYPHQLSGGQQQRTALARMLVSAPEALLLDEPFSALDSHLRFRLERELRQRLRAFGKTVILVSHDRNEVFRMADSMVVLENGRVEDSGAKAAVFAKPRSRASALLTGCKNISRLEQRGDGKIFAADWGIELSADAPASAKYIGIRMHDLRAEQGENAFFCAVVEELENPFSYTIMLRPEGAESAQPLGWETDKETWRELRAERLWLRLPRESLLLLEE